jgi:ParB-like chromosome segregation protein Spo0J
LSGAGSALSFDAWTEWQVQEIPDPEKGREEALSVLEESAMAEVSQREIRSFRLELFDERFGGYRLAAPEAEPAMMASLRQFGQLSPVVCCLREEVPCLLDGYRRLQAARRLEEIDTLDARFVKADDREAKAAIYRLNQMGRRIHVLEEAWIISALVREDGLSQQEVAELLGRHKSWVCRRLALLEKLDSQARQDLQLGLLSPSAARQLLRLPRGNQREVLECMRRESLSVVETGEVVDLLLASSTREQKEFVLEKPRQALAQARGGPVRSWDPRLSTAGNRVVRKLAWLLDNLAGMENWLRHRGRGELSLCDCTILSPGFARLAQDGKIVAELADDLVAEMKLP